MPFKEEYLVMVTANNNNKWYKMVQQDEDSDTFLVSYGRVQGHTSTKEYPLNKWDSLLNSKIRKGYTRLTQILADEDTIENFKDISDSQVNMLINKLQAYSQGNVKNNYTIATDSVTKLQLDTSQEALNNAIVEYQADPNNIELINKHLLELYTILPRKMDKVQHFLIQEDSKKSWIDSLLANEQDILDSLATQVGLTQVDDKEAKSILDVLGITIKTVNDSNTIKSIKDLMGESSQYFNNVYEIVNIKTSESFTRFNRAKPHTNVQLLFHGSRNSNWLSILQNGLLIRPAGVMTTGSMFGDGIYFADRARKSIGYTSIHGSYWARGNNNEAYLALYNVYLGKELEIKTYNDQRKWKENMSAAGLMELGLDSVHAYDSPGFLFNPEFIVYNSSQCTVEYLIELKS